MQYTYYDLWGKPIGISVVDVCCNPTDPWAWVGLAGDCIDLIPFVTGVGEGIKGLKVVVKIANKTADVADAVNDGKKAVKATDKVSDSVKQLDNVSDAAKAAKKSGSTTGPYAYLEDGPTVGAGKDFTATQKQKMLEENMKRNGGVVKSDNPNDYYDVLTKPKKSMKGVTPDQKEWQFDHIIPKDKGGTNSYSNCQIVSRKYNREKWNK